MRVTDVLHRRCSVVDRDRDIEVPVPCSSRMRPRIPAPVREGIFPVGL